MKAQEAMKFFHKSSKGLIHLISSAILLKCVIKSPSFIYKFLLLELSLTGIVHPPNWLTGPLDAWIIFANVSLFFSGKTNTSTWRLILTPRLKLFV